MKKYILLALLVTIFFPAFAQAKIGVGVGTGEIRVDEILKPGLIYRLPPLTVINTGDVTSDYEVEVSYRETQDELKIPQEWIKFEPKTFTLEPSDAQAVDVSIDLPVKAVPGEYFSYLEAHPLKEQQTGVTSIGVAAAARLYFEIEPANFLEGIYYKLLSLWRLYAPWPQRVSIFLGVIVALVIFRKFFNLNINIKRPTKKAKTGS